MRNILTSPRNNQSRSVIQAFVFLLKLRIGNSKRTTASISKLKNELDVSDYSNSVVNFFESDVLPFCFGFNFLSKDDPIQNHTTVTAKKLFN